MKGFLALVGAILVGVGVGQLLDKLRPAALIGAGAGLILADLLRRGGSAGGTGPGQAK